MRQMIEIVLLRYLERETGLPVSMEVPEKPPEEFITLEKTGGGEKDHIQTAMFAIRSYGGSLLRAAEINEQVKTAMKAMPEKTEVFRAELNGDYNYTDTRTKRYRYQAVYDITY